MRVSAWNQGRCWLVLGWLCATVAGAAAPPEHPKVARTAADVPGVFLRASGQLRAKAIRPRVSGSVMEFPYDAVALLDEIDRKALAATDPKVRAIAESKVHAALTGRNIVPVKRKREQDPPAAPVLIPFEINSFVLKPEAVPLLDAVVEQLARGAAAGQRVAINGHTDTRTGSDRWNMVLSGLRALRVAYYLVTKGNIARDRLEIRGYGMNAPRFPEDTQEGIEKNRRVEFELLEAAAPDAGR